jgi:hypothetical protein
LSAIPGCSHSHARHHPVEVQIAEAGRWRNPETAGLFDTPAKTALCSNMRSKQFFISDFTRSVTMTTCSTPDAMSRRRWCQGWAIDNGEEISECFGGWQHAGAKPGWE